MQPEVLEVGLQARNHTIRKPDWTITSLLKALARCCLLLPALAVGADKCYPTKLDPSWNQNHNSKGSACHKQVTKVRKLEFDPRFDCSEMIRKKWQAEYDIAMKMKCNL